jgi:hypothetical protein
MASINSDLFMATTFVRTWLSLGKRKSIEITGFFSHWWLDSMIDFAIGQPRLVGEQMRRHAASCAKLALNIWESASIHPNQAAF